MTGSQRMSFVHDDFLKDNLPFELCLAKYSIVQMLRHAKSGGIAGAKVSALGGDALPELTSAEHSRYNRHLILPEVGEAGQRRLKRARVLLVGAGGLGSPSAMYLAAAGVGHLGIVDDDVVDVSNLQRQILHSTSQVGQAKTKSAQRRLNDLNPHVTVQTYPTRLSAQNALTILLPYDVVLDGTDNFATRYLINDACVLLGKPNIHGSIHRFEGQVSVFSAPGGPCYRCLYPEPPPPGSVPSCAEGGVLGVLPGIIGSIQAVETIKWILQQGDSLVGRILFFDALAMRFRELTLHRDPHCPRCGEKPRLGELVDETVTCGNHLATESVDRVDEIDTATLREWLASGRPLQILDVREAFEFQNFALPNAQLIPLAEVIPRMHEINTDRDTVVCCRIGVRSAHAIQLLREEGFSGKLFNLQGGLEAWNRKKD